MKQHLGLQVSAAVKLVEKEFRDPRQLVVIQVEVMPFTEISHCIVIKCVDRRWVRPYVGEEVGVGAPPKEPRNNFHAVRRSYVGHCQPGHLLQFFDI